MRNTYHLRLTNCTTNKVRITTVKRAFFEKCESDPDILDDFLPDDGEYDKVYLSHKQDGITEKLLVRKRTAPVTI